MKAWAILVICMAVLQAEVYEPAKMQRMAVAAQGDEQGAGRRHGRRRGGI